MGSTNHWLGRAKPPAKALNPQNALKVIVVSVRWMPGMSNSFDDK